MIKGEELFCLPWSVFVSVIVILVAVAGFEAVLFCNGGASRCCFEGGELPLSLARVFVRKKRAC